MRLDHCFFRGWFVLMVLFCHVTLANSNELYPFENQEKKERFYHMLNELRCLVCQNQNLADSNAKLAMDLKTIVYDKVRANESDKSIKLYLTKRYGHYVLFKPPMNIMTSFLWLLPVVFLLTALTLLFRFIVRKA